MPPVGGAAQRGERTVAVRRRGAWRARGNGPGASRRWARQLGASEEKTKVRLASSRRSKTVLTGQAANADHSAPSARFPPPADQSETVARGQPVRDVVEQVQLATRCSGVALVVSELPAGNQHLQMEYWRIGSFRHFSASTPTETDQSAHRSRFVLCSERPRSIGSAGCDWQRSRGEACSIAECCRIAGGKRDPLCHRMPEERDPLLHEGRSL